jgi:hypothetical protein
MILTPITPAALKMAQRIAAALNHRWAFVPLSSDLLTSFEIEQQAAEWRVEPDHYQDVYAPMVEIDGIDDQIIVIEESEMYSVRRWTIRESGVVTIEILNQDHRVILGAVFKKDGSERSTLIDPRHFAERHQLSKTNFFKADLESLVMALEIVGLEEYRIQMVKADFSQAASDNQWNKKYEKLAETKEDLRTLEWDLSEAPFQIPLAESKVLEEIKEKTKQYQKELDEFLNREYWRQFADLPF